MFTTYLHAKFYATSSSGSLVICTKPKAKYGFHATTMLLFYTAYKKNYLHKSCIYLLSLKTDKPYEIRYGAMLTAYLQILYYIFIALELQSSRL
jgi:hypothetical protein